MSIRAGGTWSVSSMKFASTRGKVKGLTFEEALLSTCYSVDGGILMPESFPRVEQSVLEKWKRLSFVDLTKEIFALFIDEEEIPRVDLEELVDKAFTGFRFDGIVDMVEVKGFYLLELFHGKTMAFKDLSLATVGQFLQYFLSKKKKNMTLLVATSGDTGSAAIESVRNMQNIDIVVMLPKGMCTKIQEQQMTTVLDSNVHTFIAEGTSDDIDVLTKDCLTNSSYAAEHSLGSISSINWARIMGQIVHFFYGYLQVCQDIGQIIRFVVPTGAMGHITAGAVAWKMGLPVELVCAVNDNDIVHRVISSGDYSVAKRVQSTWSSAMDIQMPYNMERIFWIFADGDSGLVKSIMQDFEKTKAVNLKPSLREKIGEVVSSGVVSKEQTLQTMRTVWEDQRYLLDPHTAVGITIALSVINDSAAGASIPTVCMACADPAKFPEAVKAAGIAVQQDPRVAALEAMPTRFKEMRRSEDWVRILRNTIEDITARRSTN